VQIAEFEPEGQDMTIGPVITRRLVLGSAIAIAVAPRLAFGQKQADGWDVTVEFAFDRHIFTASLEDNPSARDLVSLLPLSLLVEDYAANEKIVYLPRKLTTEGSGPFGNEAPGDLCHYAPVGEPRPFLRGLPLLEWPDPPRPLRQLARTPGDPWQIPDPHHPTA
jgi:hypothetical protein